MSGAEPTGSTRRLISSGGPWEASAGGSVRPAATMVEVRALIDPSLLIEIEAVARRG